MSEETKVRILIGFTAAAYVAIMVAAYVSGS